MIERALLMVGLIAAGYLLFQICRRCNLRNAAVQAIRDPLLADVPDNRTTIVYFTTPGCIPCQTQTQQLPALTKLQTELGDRVHVVKVDAVEDPDTARRWGVMSAPTTFVLGKDGSPRAVNYGVADEQKLKTQVMEAV